MMNAIKSAVSALVVLFSCVQSVMAIDVPPTTLPVDDGGLLLVAAAGLAVAIKIVRWKQRR